VANKWDEESAGIEGLSMVEHTRQNHVKVKAMGLLFGCEGESRKMVRFVMQRNGECAALLIYRLGKTILYRP
jgi:hypothetical protein